LVIPVEKWDSLFSGNKRQALQYIPGGYTNAFEKPGMYETLKVLDSAEFEVWKEDYHAYLEHIGDRVRGRKLCQNCLLEPKADTFGLQRIIVGEMIESGQLTQPTVEILESGDFKKMNQKKSIACSIHNRFNCPFKGSDHYNDKKLIDLGEIINTVESALSFAAEDHILYDEPLDVDFQRDIVIVRSRPSDPTHIKNLPVPKKVKVDRVVDVQMAVTEPDVIRSLLEQYFSSEMRHLNMKSFKEAIVSFLINYKDKLKLEVLCDANGLLQDDSEDAFKQHIEYWKSRYWTSGKCFACGTASCQIRCSNCNEFMCVNHWQEHMAKKHSKTEIR